MKNMIKISTLIIVMTFVLLMPLKSWSQSQCFKADSIVVNYIPWKLKSRLSLSPNDIRNFEENIVNHSKKVFTEPSVLQEFVELPLTSTKVVNQKDVDVRMVIDVYFEGNFRVTTALNAVGFYNYLDSTYGRNEDLNQWLKKHVGTSPISFSEAR